MQQHANIYTLLVNVIAEMNISLSCSYADFVQSIHVCINLGSLRLQPKQDGNLQVLAWMDAQLNKAQTSVAQKG